MIGKHYRVTFKTGIEEVVYALGRIEAKILAQAKQIRAGNAFDVQGIEEVKLPPEDALSCKRYWLEWGK